MMNASRPSVFALPGTGRRWGASTTRAGRPRHACRPGSPSPAMPRWCSADPPPRAPDHGRRAGRTPRAAGTRRSGVLCRTVMFLQGSDRRRDVHLFPRQHHKTPSSSPPSRVLSCWRDGHRSDANARHPRYEETYPATGGPVPISGPSAPPHPVTPPPGSCVRLGEEVMPGLATVALDYRTTKTITGGCIWSRSTAHSAHDVFSRYYFVAYTNRVKSVTQPQWAARCRCIEFRQRSSTVLRK